MERISDMANVLRRTHVWKARPSHNIAWLFRLLAHRLAHFIPGRKLCILESEDIAVDQTVAGEWRRWNVYRDGRYIGTKHAVSTSGFGSVYKAV